ncbi:MAG: glycosyl transferase [Bacteroidota bacterium]
MNKIAFTICSINYLAQAKTLGDSLTKQNPDYQFFIGLVDRLEGSAVDRTKLPDYELVEVEKLTIEGFADMFDRYNITELNTAVKPFFLQYFYDKYPEAQTVSYFDPDIEVFEPLSDLDQNLEHYSLVLTPHTLSPYPDGLNPKERDLLNTGVFNLGFIGTSRTAETIEFLKWWQQKLRFECFIDLANGMFVDQLWVNFAPIYWQKVLIYRHLGYNMAYWNLHERNLGFKSEKYFVNVDQPLVFFHYSGYNPEKPTHISKYQNRYSFETRPDIKALFDGYAKTLQTNGYEYFQQFACAYMKPPVPWTYPRRGQRPRKWAIKQLKKLIEMVKTI